MNKSKSWGQVGEAFRVSSDSILNANILHLLLHEDYNLTDYDFTNLNNCFDNLQATNVIKE